MAFSYMDNLKLDRKYGTESDSPLHRSNRFPAEFAIETNSDPWPKRIGKTDLIWACCVSKHGPICQHLSIPTETKDN